MEEDALPEAGSTSRSNGLLAVFEKFQHLDRVLRECETAHDPIYRTCAQLWIAVAEAQTANSPICVTGGDDSCPEGENHGK